jgi:hypothetical protein
MSIPITIQGTVINIPSSSEQSNWAPGIIAALRAIATALNSVSGTYDIANQSQNIDANNSSNDVVITNLSFPVSQVRSATIFYSVYRMTEDSGSDDAQEVAEGGFFTIVYNASNPTNNKWEITQERAGTANITFEISDTGAFSFSTTALTGINHIGTISFRAIAVLNSI